METTLGACNWCQKRGLVYRLNYVDGKHHYACTECLDHAKMDVRLFNLAEIHIQNQKKASTQPQL